MKPELTSKPILLSESGSGDASFHCAKGAGEKIDAMTFGFTQVVGFNMWHALYENAYQSYQVNISAANNMNSHTLNVLEDGNGQWVQRRQIEKTGSSDNDLKENQYYVSYNGELASGFIRNRTYNTRNMSDQSLGSNCYYPVELVDHDFYVPVDISENDGPNLQVEGLSYHEPYIIEYYSYFQNGGYIGYESQYSSLSGNLTLHHPELSYSELPIIWYLVYRDDPNQVRKNHNTNESASLKFLASEDPNSNSSDYSVYPNPVKDEFHINVPEPTEISIYDSSGKLVFTITIPAGNNYINVGNLSNGLYTVKLHSLSDFYVTKFIKN